jgi:hypothetical protein
VLLCYRVLGVVTQSHLEIASTHIGRLQSAEPISSRDALQAAAAGVGPAQRACLPTGSAFANFKLGADANAKPNMHAQHYPSTQRSLAHGECSSTYQPRAARSRCFLVESSCRVVLLLFLWIRQCEAGGTITSERVCAISGTLISSLCSFWSGFKAATLCT